MSRLFVVLTLFTLASCSKSAVQPEDHRTDSAPDVSAIEMVDLSIIQSRSNASLISWRYVSPNALRVSEADGRHRNYQISDARALELKTKVHALVWQRQACSKPEAYDGPLVAGLLQADGDTRHFDITPCQWNEMNQLTGFIRETARSQ